jgi:hypothetical protein
MIHVNGRLTPSWCRGLFHGCSKLSTAFWCLIRVSSSMLLMLLTMLHFITHNTATRLWISRVGVWISGTCIHMRRSEIARVVDVRTLRGTFLSYPFWECRGEWGALVSRIYICISLRRLTQIKYHSATLTSGAGRMVAVT